MSVVTGALDEERQAAVTLERSEGSTRALEILRLRLQNDTSPWDCCFQTSDSQKALVIRADGG